MRSYLTFILLFISVLAFGQRLKYKDIYPLLAEQRMEEAVPMLKEFLADKKNADEPNANLQMAYVFEDEALNARIIADSSRLYHTADSAILFFYQAKVLIDEREVKKNDDYYQEFYRRDLRTGEFGIKLSDIQLEIDAKVKQLRDRVDKARLINNNLAEIQSLYEASQEAYQQLNRKYSNYNDLLLASGDEELALLSVMAENEPAIDRAVNTITSAVIRLDNTGIDTDYIKKPIEKYALDGLSKPEFDAGNFQVWGYADWARKARHTIMTETRPLQYAIVDFYHGLGDLEKQLKKDKSLTEDELWQKTDLSSIEAIKSYDNSPFAWYYMDYKGQELRYSYLTDTAIVKELQDSSSVSFAIGHNQRILGVLENQLKALDALSEIKIADDKLKYSQMINEEGGVNVIEKTIASAIKINEQRSELYSDALLYWRDRAKWGVLPDDSVNLEYPVDSLVMADLDSFGIALAISPENSIDLYTISLFKHEGVIHGSMVAFADSRENLWRTDFDLFGKGLHKRDTLALAASFVSSGEDAFTAYIFDRMVTDKENLAVVNVAYDGTMNWQVNLKVPNAPVKTTYNDTLGETILFLVAEEALSSLGPDERGYIVIDRNGTIR